MGIERTFEKLVLAGALAMSVSACGGEDAKDYSNVQLKVNEVQAKNSNTYMDQQDSSYPDWFELYNAGDGAVNLEGFLVGDSKDQFALAAGVGEIAAKGFMVLIADKKPENGVNHVGFKLSGGGDKVIIADPNGKTLDQVDTPIFTDDQSGDMVYARYPDGTGDWASCPAGPTGGATPGASNGASCTATAATTE